LVNSVHNSVVVVVLPDPFQETGAQRNSTETQQSGHAPRSGPEVKIGKVVQKMARLRGSDVGQSRRRRARYDQLLHQRLVISTCGAVPAPRTRGGSKWRDNFPEGFDQPVTPNRLDSFTIAI